MELAGLKVRMADHSNRVRRKLASAYGFLTNFELATAMGSPPTSYHMLQKHQDPLQMVTLISSPTCRFANQL